MKQYLLSLRSGDFVKSDSTWTTQPINLYSNSSYKNYSTVRSAYGLNLIGDRTFVGLEVASPSFDADHATPSEQNSIYVTDYGEVVYESATPTLSRFVDTTSQIDILTFSHKFVNLNGNTDPTFSLVIYESDDESGPWLESYSSGEISTLFMRDVKKYIKIELEIDDDEADLSTTGLIFFLEVGIHDIIPPVISRTGKNVLRRFPTWTKIHEDSIDSATPALDVPSSDGGKFLTAVVQDNFNFFENIVDINSVNSYINTADENQIAWIYATYMVPAADSSFVYGDDIRLSPVSSLNKMLALKATDYAYYYNAIDRTIYTNRKFDRLVINSFLRDQDPVNIFNDFDELGARVGLPRLYLESNSNFKKRILDVSQNPDSGSTEGFKRTLRRELDIWRAYGSTPDSNYIGATPEILEITDIEKSTPYFDEDLKPLPAFRQLIQKINSKYPSNIGYVKWGEGVWDYGGFNSEGISRISSVYDESASPLGNYYQPGVGDFNDAKFEIVNTRPDVDSQSSVIDFSGSVTINGTLVDGTDYSYDPIIVEYSYFASYLRGGSTYYTSPISDKVVLNSSNTISSSTATPSVIDIQDAKDKILYPADATPQNVYYTVSRQPNYTPYNGKTVNSYIGGYSKFHGDQTAYLVPSSPNIMYSIYDSSLVLSQTEDFFTSATVNYSSSDRYIYVESATADYYPFEYETSSSFTAVSDYTMFEGYIDEYGNTYESSEEPVNTIYIGDKVIGDYNFSLDTFNLSSPGNYTVEKATFNSATPGVKVYVQDDSNFVRGLNAAFANYEVLPYTVLADAEESYRLSVHPGYIYYSEDDWYIYRAAETQEENGRFFEVELDKTPNSSKPFIVSVDGEEWRHAAFENSATPGDIVFVNTESIEYRGNNKLRLAYTDVSEVEVVDSYTSNIVNSGISESNGIIYPFDSATPGVTGRYYNVSYKLNKSFYVDPDVLVGEDYHSYIYFSSTPSSDVDYSITYESSLQDGYNYIDLDIDQYENPLTEGFVYISDEDYDFGTVEYKLSPSYLYDNTDDFMNLSIISYDENHNLKPGQTFRIYGNNITAIPEYVTTNDNGLGITKVYYSGSVPTTLITDQLNIVGVSSSDPNGGLNSVSENYSESVQFDMLSENYFNLQVKAVPLRRQVEANGTDDVIIYGQVYWLGYPITFAVDIDWYVADYVADLFNGNSTANTITTGSDGKFILQNAITAKNKNDPGIRFVRVNLNSPSTVVSNLQSQGETIASNDVTISGDIVYWNESFNNIEFFDDNSSLPRDLIVVPDENRLLNKEPAFRYEHTDPTVIRYTQPTLPWTTERWVPLSRYQQYQLGLFGSTPNTITTYSNIHPDHGDS